MRRLLITLFALVLLSGCSDNYMLSSEPVKGEVMFRVVETGGAAQGGAGGLVTDVQGAADRQGCRVETTKEPIEGDLVANYQGTRCSVTYTRSANDE